MRSACPCGGSSSTSALVYAFLYIPIAVVVAAQLQRGWPADRLDRLLAEMVCRPRRLAEDPRPPPGTASSSPSSSRRSRRCSARSWPSRSRRAAESAAPASSTRCLRDAADHSRHRAGHRAPVLVHRAEDDAGAPFDRARPRHLRPRLCLHGRAHAAEAFRLRRSSRPRPTSAPGRREPSSRWCCRPSCPASSPAALLAFTLSVDEFIIAYFTAGAGSASTTLPMQIYAMIRFGVTPEINALATVTLAFTVCLLVAQPAPGAREGSAA